jgi:hypothetical protein
MVDQALSVDSAPSVGSTSVTLSNEAMTLARLSSKGIQVSSGQLSEPLAMGGSSPSSISLAAQDKNPMSVDALKRLLKNMGADDETIATLVQGFDADQDQKVSEAEIVRGLSEIGNDKDSKFAETLRRFMDMQGDGSGSVSGREFMAISSKLYAALKQ